MKSRLQHVGGSPSIFPARQRLFERYEYNGCADAMSKNALFEPFLYKNEHFTKTVSGQIFGKHSITRPFFI